MKIFFYILILLCGTACGFKPLYSEDYNQEQQNVFANIEIEVMGGDLGKKFSNFLEDLINPEDISKKPKYKLSISAVKRVDPYLIDKDSITKRYNVVLTSDYKLFSYLENKIIDQGTINITNSYSASLYSEFATYVSEEDATDNSLKDLAEELRKRLIVQIAE
jgi:hypothetical protein